MENDPWSEWKASDEGKTCRDYATLKAAEFLENRLWWAFNAGVRAGEKSSQFANQESALRALLQELLDDRTNHSLDEGDTNIRERIEHALRRSAVQKKS